MRETVKPTIKLLVFDLDDTLLDSSQRITPRSRQAIRRAVEQGITVTLATGRMYSSTVDFAAALELGEIPLITYNGAMVSNFPSGQVLFHQPLAAAAARQVFQLCRGQQWYVQTYVDDVLYVKELDQYAKLYARVTGAKPVAIGERLFSMTAAPTKMLAIADPANIQQMKALFAAQLGNTLCVAESKPNFLEITAPSVNKGKALQLIASRLQVKQAEIMAFGNGGNDLEMLGYAGWGVAVANAPAAVKQAARLITKSNDEEGVAAVIERYILG